MSNVILSQRSTDKTGCIILDNNNIKTTIVDILFLWKNAVENAVSEKA